MRRALTYARDFDALIVHHTEDPDLVGEGVMNEGEFAARLGLVGIPNAAEAVMLERDMRLVALTGGRYHAASLSCIESLEILKRARDAGLAVSASVSINHVTLNENDIGPYRTFLKLSPPLRTEDDRLALVAARRLRPDRRHHVRPQSAGRRGQAAAVRGSRLRRDRACRPCCRRRLRLIHNGDMDFKTLIRAMSTRPAELLGLPGGTLRAGRAGRRDRDRCRHALGARSRRSQIAMQEHAVRRSALLGPRGAHHRRRPDGLRACLTCVSDARQGVTADGDLTLLLLVAFILGYLLGSIPFGLILTRLAGTPDLRSIGSGNIGATNVLRTGRKGLAAATLLLDMLKGTVAVIIAGYFGGPNAAMLAALGAFLGHLFPVWLKFQRRQGRRGLYRRADRPVLAGRGRVLRDLARDRRRPRATPRSRRWSQVSSRRSSCGGSATPRWPRCSPC